MECLTVPAIVIAVSHMLRSTPFPKHQGSAEADMMAASVKLAATFDERQGVMRLLYSMAPKSARVVAEMLGFDPDMVIPLLEVRLGAASRYS